MLDVTCRCAYTFHLDHDMSLPRLISTSNPYQCLDPDVATLEPSIVVSHTVPSIQLPILGGVPAHYIYTYLDISSLACVTSICHTYHHISKHQHIMLPIYSQWNRFVTTWLEMYDVMNCHPSISRPCMIKTSQIISFHHPLLHLHLHPHFIFNQKFQ